MCNPCLKDGRRFRAPRYMVAVAEGLGSPVGPGSIVGVAIGDIVGIGDIGGIGDMVGIGEGAGCAPAGRCTAAPIAAAAKINPKNHLFTLQILNRYNRRDRCIPANRTLLAMGQ